MMMINKTLANNLKISQRLYSTKNGKDNNNDINDNNEYSKNKTYDDQINLWNDFAKYYNDTKSNSNTADYEFLDSSSQLNNKIGLLTHIDNLTNRPKQVDISEKLLPSDTKRARIACASGYIQLNESAYNAIVNDELKKGNALIVAQLAGINASKQTQHLIPLCHQILLDVCDVEFKCDNLTHRIYCEAVCKTSKSATGVEMEALTACSISLLTIYDMCKAIQKDAVIKDIQLEYKLGGKTGDFKRSHH